MKNVLLFSAIVISLSFADHEARFSENAQTITLEIISGQTDNAGHTPGVYQIVEGEYSQVVELEAFSDVHDHKTIARNLKRIYQAFEVMGIDEENLIKCSEQTSDESHAAIIRYIGVIEYAEESPYLTI